MENILGYLSLLFSSCAAEMVEVDVKPLINLFMQIVVLVANLSRGQIFLYGFHFRSSTYSLKKIIEIFNLKKKFNK